MRIEHYEFWKIVEQLGWGTQTVDYKVAGARLRDMGLDIKALYEVFAQYKVELKSRIFDWEKANDQSCRVGDDRFDDLTSHIIGLGRTEYERVMIDPSLAVLRAQKHYEPEEGFVESFAYIFNWG